MSPNILIQQRNATRADRYALRALAENDELSRMRLEALSAKYRRFSELNVHDLIEHVLEDGRLDQAGIFFAVGGETDVRSYIHSAISDLATDGRIEIPDGSESSEYRLVSAETQADEMLDLIERFEHVTGFAGANTLIESDGSARLSLPAGRLGLLVRKLERLQRMEERDA